MNSGRKFQGDDGKDVTVDLGKTLNIKGGATAVSDANNVGIVRGDDNTLNVRLAKDLTGLNSVTTGITVVFGTSIATIFGVFLIPMLFVIVENIGRRSKKKKQGNSIAENR